MGDALILVVGVAVFAVTTWATLTAGYVAMARAADRDADPSIGPRRAEPGHLAEGPARTSGNRHTTDEPAIHGSGPRPGGPIERVA